MSHFTKDLVFYILPIYCDFPYCPLVLISWAIFTLLCSSPYCLPVCWPTLLLLPPSLNLHTCTHTHPYFCSGAIWLKLASNTTWGDPIIIKSSEYWKCLGLGAGMKRVSEYVKTNVMILTCFLKASSVAYQTHSSCSPMRDSTNVQWGRPSLYPRNDCFSFQSNNAPVHFKIEQFSILYSSGVSNCWLIFLIKVLLKKKVLLKHIHVPSFPYCLWVLLCYNSRVE